MLDEGLAELLKDIEHLKMDIGTSLVYVGDDEQEAYEASERIPDTAVSKMYGSISDSRTLMETWLEQLDGIEAKVKALKEKRTAC